MGHNGAQDAMSHIRFFCGLLYIKQWHFFVGSKINLTRGPCQLVITDFVLIGSTCRAWLEMKVTQVGGPDGRKQIIFTGFWSKDLNFFYNWYIDSGCEDKALHQVWRQNVNYIKSYDRLKKMANFFINAITQKLLIGSRRFFSEIRGKACTLNICKQKTKLFMY